MDYKVNIVYKNVKNLKLSLDSNGDVNVSSPLSIAKKDILKLLKDKEAWILKQRTKILAAQKYDYSKYDLSNGKKVYFLGREYPIKLTESQHNVINEYENYLEFFLNPSVINNQDFKMQLLEGFYKDKADLVLNNLVAKYLKITQQEIQRVSLKKTKTRWGSCNYIKKTINLNFDLILRDIEAIEYVILHEIAHLTYPNHSKDFYAYIASYMPDWKTREKRLK